MTPFYCTLLTDGSSDAALLPILEWTTRQHAVRKVANFEWADLGRLRQPIRDLADRVRLTVEYFPCDLLFVHRDAEGEDPMRRYGEIQTAVQSLVGRGIGAPHVCVVPVRMQEAWLLLDSAAIRKAAGNPNDAVDLELPRHQDIERLPDPKTRLHAALKIASQHHGRRLKAFRPERSARLVTTYMTNFHCLRTLSAFCRLEDDIRGALADLGA